MTRRRLRRGVFHSLVDLQAAIHRYLAEHNADPKPFVWTATPEKIIASCFAGAAGRPRMRRGRPPSDGGRRRRGRCRPRGASIR